ncbi:MAG: AmpG family muropeptide MFS transporter [Desulfobacterales bacterium]|nr:MAG: AmpG family muropeptide MFS transporter [Desulfobacterales bacterium]
MIPGPGEGGEGRPLWPLCNPPTRDRPVDRLPLHRQIFTRKMLVSFLMGFSCGLPLLLTITLLQAWMTDAGVDLGAIGLMSLTGLPYTLKFLWAPLLDRFVPAGTSGRRRGWLLWIQSALILSVVLLGRCDPAARPLELAAAAFFLAFFSASQDAVVDAYRREDLSDNELGLGASLYVNGYRTGMLLASGGGLMLADQLSFADVYLVMAICLLPGLLTTLFAPEPPRAAAPPHSMLQAAVAPLAEYFSRKNALWMLAFILCYKIGDTLALTMTTPFYLDVGFSKTEIGAVVKLFGYWALVGGGLLGGVIMLRIGINRSLWIFGVLQAVTILGFVLLARIGPENWALAVVVAGENLAGGMGTTAFTAFMASLTDRRFTATQYALLTSLMGLPRVAASAGTGYLAEALGWEGFFIFCTAAAVPGFFLLMRFAPLAGKTRRNEMTGIPLI